MSIQGSNRTIRWLVLALILIVSGGLIYAGTVHAVAEHWAGGSSAGLWIRAAALEPGNADNWYRLGRYRQLDFEHEDLPQAISYYRRAITIQPLAARYWLDLAGAYESSGDPGLAEDAYHTAQKDYPISGEVAWRYGNFLLRQGRVDEAFAQFQHAVAVDPQYAPLTVSRAWHGTQDVDRILRYALPATPDAYWGAIQFFVSIDQADAAMAVWKRLASSGAPLPLLRVSPLLDLLLRSKHADDARTVWQQTVVAAGSEPQITGGSLIWDGGFERPLLNAGLAWRYQPVDGAEVDWDEQIYHSGHRSLRITFDGTANVDFRQFWQYVVVEPNTAYRFTAYVRTEDLSTDSGFRFVIEDVTPPPVTPNIVGTQPWALDDMKFTTGPQTRLVRVLLERWPSQMLANKVRGTVWVDDVSLIPIANVQGSNAPAPRVPIASVPVAAR